MEKLLSILLVISIYGKLYSQHDTIQSHKLQYNISAGRHYFSLIGDTAGFTGYMVEYFDYNPMQKIRWIQKLNKGIVLFTNEFYENGTLKRYTTCNYKGATPNGLYEEWYENGQLKISGSYLRGDKVGLWTTYHSNGKKQSKGNYKIGEPVGKWHYWDADGKLVSNP